MRARIQEKAAGAKAEEVQKKVQAATAHEEDDDEVCLLTVV